MQCVKLLGQRLMAREFDRQVAEGHVRVAVLSRSAALGVPVAKTKGRPCQGQGERRPNRDLRKNVGCFMKPDRSIRISAAGAALNLRLSAAKTMDGPGSIRACISTECDLAMIELTDGGVGWAREAPARAMQPFCIAPIRVTALLSPQPHASPGALAGTSST